MAWVLLAAGAGDYGASAWVLLAAGAGGYGASAWVLLAAGAEVYEALAWVSLALRQVFICIAGTCAAVSYALYVAIALLSLRIVPGDELPLKF